MQDLQGKVALITGSTSGIGAAAASALAQHGVKVTVTGRNREQGEKLVEEIRAAEGQAFYIPTDLTHPDAPTQLVQEAVKYWNRLDIVVNNAAITCNKPLEAVTNADWDELFQLNVKAAFFIVQAALPWLEQRRGVVLNMSSINAWVNANNNFVYDCSKAALNHLTRGLALDLIHRGVRVNTLMPGGTHTPMLHQWIEQKFSAEQAQETIEHLKRDPFVAAPQQIADIIVLMCSERSSWINGAEIPADGGKFLL
jgi:NAD(P)-dependent dehydrogenase (short-subunit alcohol dehydrogenase family)